MAAPAEMARAVSGGMFRTAMRIGDLTAGLVRPWLMLATRLWLAQAFLVVQVTGLMLGGDLGATLTGGWWIEAARQIAQSGPGALVQAACPVLLLLGLFARPAALAMLVQVVVLPPPSMTVDRGVLWAALLVWIVVSGAGAFSLDRLLAPGALFSPLPGRRALARVYGWMDARLAPAALMLGRLLVAATVVPAWFGKMPLPFLSAVPAMVSTSVLYGLALLLAVGLGVRPVSKLLALSIPFAVMATDLQLFWLMLLGVLAVNGGGMLSLDGLLRRLAAARPAGEPEGLPHVVVVGGGFGGAAAVRGLAGAACRVTLIDRRNHQVFQPLLYQVATAGLSPAEIATPIRALFRGQANARVLLAEVVGVEDGAVLLDRGRVAYDVLVLATGARHAYFGRDEWSGLAPGLKSIEDATDIRRRLLTAFERAEGTEDKAERAAWMTFVVVGGGPTGVELAGAIAELARHGMDGEFRSINPAEARVLLVQSGPRLLPSFSVASSDKAAASLRALGVEVLLDRKVSDLQPGVAVIDDQVLPARTVLWAAGVMASPAAQWLGLRADRAGRAPVGPDLSAPGHPNVFVVGDTAASDAWGGAAVPGLAPAAKQGGAYAARVIRARLDGRAAPPPFRYRHLGSLATIGREAAVAEFGRLRFSGAIAWWLWGAVHIAFLAGGRSRVAVVLDWVWAYLTFKRSTRLITGGAVD